MSFEFTEEFVRECLNLCERGDGVLFASIHRGKLIYDRSRKKWFFLGDSGWEIDTYYEAINGVEECALIYEQMAKACVNDESGFFSAALRNRAFALRKMSRVKKTLVWARTVDPEMSCHKVQI
jgi:hypothetical protein